MAVRFQYNKTSLQEMRRQLRMREDALPILKSKEAALRVEVKKAKRDAEETARLLACKREVHAPMAPLWDEMDFSLVGIERVRTRIEKIAGVRIPVLDGVDFEVRPYSLFARPAWFPAGIALLQGWAALTIRRKLLVRRMELLDHARKRTTQKVNLYEKVQIPEYEDAIRKITRYLEDAENLAKAAQKIVKRRRDSSRRAS